MYSESKIAKALTMQKKKKKEINIFLISCIVYIYALLETLFYPFELLQ